MKPFTSRIQIWVIVVLALALAVVPGAAPATGPPLQLGPITVADGTAGISGTISGRSSRTALTVNGNPLGLDGSGAFHGVVSLDGASSIDIALSELGAKQETEYVIPLSGALLGAGGVIPGGVLDSLDRAGVSLLAPVQGPSGSVLNVSGAVRDRKQLAGLSVNGIDILGALQPDGTFSIQLPGTTTVVTLTAIDASGNTQSQTTRAFQPSRAGTVSAARAVGLRITKVRFGKKGSLRTRRMRMTVTLKDRRGLLVRGAKIAVRSTRAGRLVRQPRASKSGVRGMATFVLRLRAAAYGKRLVLVTAAKTPRARAVRRSVVLVPRRRACTAKP
jgi:hypothetical protein